MRRLRTMALVAAIALIVALTLTPGSPLPYRVLADLVAPRIDPELMAAALNVLLFMPLGAVIGWFRRPALLLAAVGASVTIELLQFVLPDRNPLLSDVIANSLGAGLGYLAFVLGHRLAHRLPERLPKRLSGRQEQMQP